MPLATALAQSGAQLRRSLQNDRTKWKLVRCNTALTLTLTLALTLALTFTLTLTLFWTRNEGPRTGSRQRHHSTVMGKNCHHNHFHDGATKTTGSLLSVKQTKPVRASVKAGDVEGLPRQCPLVVTPLFSHISVCNAKTRSSVAQGSDALASCQKKVRTNRKDYDSRLCQRRSERCKVRGAMRCLSVSSTGRHLLQPARTPQERQTWPGPPSEDRR